MATDSTPTVPSPPRSTFAELVRSIGDGSLDEELSKTLGACVLRLAAIAGDNGKASAVLTLKMKVTADRGTFDVDADFTMKEPSTARPRTVLHLNPRDGSLSRNRPEQQTDAFPAKQLPLVDERPARSIGIVTN